MLMWHAGEGARWAAAAERRMHCAVAVRDLKKKGSLVEDEWWVVGCLQASQCCSGCNL